MIAGGGGGFVWSRGNVFDQLDANGDGVLSREDRRGTFLGAPYLGASSA